MPELILLLVGLSLQTENQLLWVPVKCSVGSQGDRPHPGVCLVSVSLLSTWQPGQLLLLAHPLVYLLTYPSGSPWAPAGHQAWALGTWRELNQVGSHRIETDGTAQWSNRGRCRETELFRMKGGDAAREVGRGSHVGGLASPAQEVTSIPAVMKAPHSWKERAEVIRLGCEKGWVRGHRLVPE